MSNDLVMQFRDIDGVKYGVAPLPAMRGFRLKAKLLADVLPAVALAFDKDNARGLADAASQLFQALTPDELEAATRELLYRSTADGKLIFNGKGVGDLFETHFAGRTHIVWQLLRFAAEVNWSGFFDELRKRLGPALQTLISQFSSQSASSSAVPATDLSTQAG